MSTRLLQAFARFDVLNAEGPGGKELVYAQRMTDWLHRLESNPSEPLQLAARSQHLMRWKIPRDTFPMDREGYLRWRTTLYDFHGDRAAEVLREVGYDEQTIARVRLLLRKERIKADPEAQLLEDVICLVFLENYFADFARDRDEPKLVRILQRTWKKMSPRGHAAAMALQLPPRERELIAKGLAPGGRDGTGA